MEKFGSKGTREIFGGSEAVEAVRKKLEKKGISVDVGTLTRALNRNGWNVEATIRQLSSD